MEIFLDTAKIDEINIMSDFINGVTTNPSLIAQSKIDNYDELIEEICRMVSGPVSVEVLSNDADAMLEEGNHLSTIHSNVCVKLPCTFDGLKVCKQLSKVGIMTNLTLCFSSMQALLAAKCGATYISPFIGRLDDIGHDGIGLVEEILEIYDACGYKTKVLSASVRNISHVVQSARLGVGAITMPAKILQQCFLHPLTDAGLEIFQNDWNKYKKSK
ncbi:MAG: fructose-6-phosphate aldolase [Oscillospiraceae bacterium]|jgi:transaldolase|nr:fructose-6-phosphate aldolase [Oscillospiraceae bacterium]